MMAAKRRKKATDSFLVGLDCLFRIENENEKENENEIRRWGYDSVF